MIARIPETLRLQVERLGLVIRTVERELELARGELEAEETQRLSLAQLQLEAARDELRLVLENRPPRGSGERPPPGVG